MKILLADDDVDMVDVTAYALRREGYSIIVATDGAQALRRWRADDPDLVLLDIGMPRINGFEVCRRIRQAASTPVIMLTGSSDEDHVVQGYGHGADDYVTKPFSAKQLALRIRAVLRRSGRAIAPMPVGELRAGTLILDVEGHRVFTADACVQLTPLEFRILHVLASNAGRVVSSSRIVDFAWGFDGGDSAVLKTHICHLRRKLNMRRGQSPDIVVIHSVGYRLAIA